MLLTIYSHLLAIPLGVFPVIGLLLAFLSLGTIGRPGQWKFPATMTALSIASIYCTIRLLKPNPTVWNVGAGSLCAALILAYFLRDRIVR